MAWLRRTGAALLLGILAAAVPPAGADDPAARPTTATPAPETTPAEGSASSDSIVGPLIWSRRPAETPIADSIEPAVERYVREHFAPCGLVGEAVPCFPVTLEVKGRQYSVRETLDNLQLGTGPVPGALPTAEEMIQHGANPHPTSAAVSFDPKAIACKTKQLLQKIQGRSRTYYLYRVWDDTGERAVLRDRPLDPDTLLASPHFHYEPLGAFEDECEALKAYLRATHEVRMRREAEAAKRSDDGVSRSGAGPE